MIRRAVRGLLALALTGILVMAGAQLASAHDVLISTNPADGSTVPRVPSQVTLTFDKVAFKLGSQIVIQGPNGNEASGQVTIVNTTVTQEIAGGAPPGTYTVLWRVTSADGHPVSGKFTFTAKAASTGTATANPTTAPTPQTTGGSGGHVGLWLVGALALVLLVAIALVARRRSEPTDPSS